MFDFSQRVLLLTDDQPRAHQRPLLINLQAQVRGWLMNAAEAGSIGAAIAVSMFTLAVTVAEMASALSHRAAALMDSMELKTDSRTVTVGFSFPEEQLEKMIQSGPLKKRTAPPAKTTTTI